MTDEPDDTEAALALHIIKHAMATHPDDRDAQLRAIARTLPGGLGRSATLLALTLLSAKALGEERASA